MSLPAPAATMANAEPIAAPMVHDVTITTTKKTSRACAMGVPPEEWGIERGARDVKSCNYCFHDIVTKTQGQLIAEGFDEDQVRALEDYRNNTNLEQFARDSIFEGAGDPSTNASARFVKITEHYVRMDYEGSGRPGIYQVITGGDDGDILKRDGKLCIEPYDVMPFACTTPVPVTHRFFGRSIADLVMDIQRINTALLRSALDNKYLANNPRVEVAESFAGPNTLDDLLVARPGGVVRTKNPGGLQWQVVPDVTASSFQFMEFMNAKLEQRTGVTRNGQGIDANALQNQSATAVNQVFNASQARMKLIARIIAEGVRDMFSLLHATIRKHGQQKETVRLTNSWVEVDPRNWKTRNDMTINVGLGTGGKAERVSHLMMLANYQKELLLGGKTNLVDDQALYNTFKQLAKLMDYKNPDQFINDPSAKDPQTGQLLHPPPPPQPDPKLQQIQLQAQLDQKADERKAQIETVQAQADIATQKDKTAAETVQMERDFDLKAKLAVLQAQLEREKFEADERRKNAEHTQRMTLEHQKHGQAMEAGVFKVAAGAQAHDQKMEQSASKSETAEARPNKKHQKKIMKAIATEYEVVRGPNNRITGFKPKQDQA